MSLFLERVKNYFIQEPLPHSAIQMASSYISGIHVSAKEKKVKSYFILPLEKGVIEPSFNQKNIKNPSLLERRVKEGLGRLHLSERRLACLIPELSLKVFALSFDSLPPSQKEREHLIRFRVKKQLPLFPDDARISFDVIRSSNSLRVLAAVARSATIAEYEDFFARFNLKVGNVGIPSLSLSHLMAGHREEDFLLVNIEEDFFSLLAILDSGVSLYRSKSFMAESQGTFSELQRVEQIIKEVENTVNFVEDREKKRVKSFWVRLGLLEKATESASLLQEKSPFALMEMDAAKASGLGEREWKILSPLIGQVL
jgi:Tfp pilus assembly PilM family ATPase